MDLSILSQFLTAGFVFEGVLFPTDKGTPQGGLISPLLANMTLDGIEALLAKQFPRMKVHLIRYADDCIITAPTREIAEHIKRIIQEFLIERGLELSVNKTLITHIDEGFDFLGWHFKKYNGVLLIKPSKKSIQRVIEKIRNVMQKAKAWPQKQLIGELNPIIRGWTNYHKHVVAHDTFTRMDFVLWGLLWHWAKRRHPNKGHWWIVDKYWHHEGTRNWVFKSDTNRLVLFEDAKVRRHPWLRLDANPFMERKYFIERLVSLRSKNSGVQTKLSFFSHRCPKLGL
jgi:RNA-directed DNA polymerase